MCDKVLSALLALLILLGLVPPPAEAVVYKLYLVPIEQVGMDRGPKYFCWEDDEAPPDCISCSLSMMDYGFTNWALLVTKDISAEDEAALEANADVFAFPENLDAPVDQDVQAYFEAINLPTDWLTPSTTWRELLRQVAGMMQFNQRYGGIAAEETGELHSIFDNATLETRLRQMTADEQRWFLATVASFGFDPDLISLNAKLRLLVKSAGDYWVGQPFYLGGYEF